MACKQHCKRLKQKHTKQKDKVKLLERELEKLQEKYDQKCKYWCWIKKHASKGLYFVVFIAPFIEPLLAVVNLLSM